MTKATPQVIVKDEAKPVIMRMITRGRRALGEEWQDVSILWDEETQGYITETTPTEAPADGQGIYVPACGLLEAEMTDYIIGWKKKQAEERAARPTRVSYESRQAEIQAMWLDFAEQKLKAFTRTSQFGPGGHSQRG